MRSRNWGGNIDLEEVSEAMGDRSETTRKQSRRARTSHTSSRRRLCRAGSDAPVLGISGRRNRRWAW